MNKILENTKTLFFGIIIGAFLGMSLSYYLLDASLVSQDKAYDIGYKTAQLECVNLIKNTK